ncbi:MAG: hypothetical protein WDW36_010217 [Sanguina aurantia]
MRSVFDALLAERNTSSAGEASLQRLTASHSCLNEKYRVSARIYERQYAPLYFARLQTLKGPIQAQAEALWPDLELTKILDVPEGREVIVIGTVYKEMKLKPTILDEYNKDRGLRAALAGTDFCSESDSIALEDDGARMVVRGPCIPVQQLVTGVVMAVRGFNEPGGDFVVSDVCFAAPAPQPAAPPLQPFESAGSGPARSSDKYVALMSGLAVGSPSTNVLQLQLAVDFLTGVLGSPAEQQLASQVVRLIIAGGTVGQMAATAGPTTYSKQSQQNTALQPIKDMDMCLSELAAALPIDLMPGAEDPTNTALPQQPLHRCLFPGAARFASLTRVTNPHELELDGVRLLGTGGQNLDDIAKYSRHEDRLAMMQHCLQWRHLAPTAPETLTCYPFNALDPFILKQTPHVMFTGNQPTFMTSLVPAASPSGSSQDMEADLSQQPSVRLIAIPSFSKTGTIVLLNLRTLQCHPMTFDTSMST